MNEYRHKPREQRLKEIIIGQSLVTFSILAITLYLVFLGLGYKINWEAKTIQHTGILYLSFSPKDAEITISAKEFSHDSPFSTSLVPGDYETKISHEGYFTWEHTAKIIADRVISFKNITLFKENPKIDAITDAGIINSINASYDSLVRNPKGDLTFNDYEIWYGDQLVTRFSTKISGVCWYPGSEYIGFQLNDEIHVIEKDGSNDVSLLKLSSSAQTNFIFSWDGANLLYKDGSEYKKAAIN